MLLSRDFRWSFQPTLSESLEGNLFKRRTPGEMEKAEKNEPAARRPAECKKCREEEEEREPDQEDGQGKEEGRASTTGERRSDHV